VEDREDEGRICSVTAGRSHVPIKCRSCAFMTSGPPMFLRRALLSSTAHTSAGCPWARISWREILARARRSTSSSDGRLPSRMTARAYSTICRMATTAWRKTVPVRAVLAGSGLQPAAGQVTDDGAVSVMTAGSSPERDVQATIEW
jgi:hypothetical protein